jgi:hypothetical protein
VVPSNIRRGGGKQFRIAVSVQGAAPPKWVQYFCPRREAGKRAWQNIPIPGKGKNDLIVRIARQVENTETAVFGE